MEDPEEIEGLEEMEGLGKRKQKEPRRQTIYCSRKRCSCKEIYVLLSD